MINVTECTITSGRDPDDVSPASLLSFGIFHPVLREFQMQCDTPELCEEWCKVLSLQDAKVKLDDFELLTVIGQVSACACVHARPPVSSRTSCRVRSEKLFGLAKRAQATCEPSSLHLPSPFLFLPCASSNVFFQLRHEDPQKGQSQGARSGGAHND
jgi:hypothetical protein